MTFTSFNDECPNTKLHRRLMTTTKKGMKCCANAVPKRKPFLRRRSKTNCYRFHGDLARQKDASCSSKPHTLRWMCLTLIDGTQESCSMPAPDASKLRRFIYEQRPPSDGSTLVVPSCEAKGPKMARWPNCNKLIESFEQ